MGRIVWIMKRKLQSAALQQVEERLLCHAVDEATHWLADGRFSAGYRCLLMGLERAKEYAESGMEWADGLAASYRSALFSYAFLNPTTERVAMMPHPGWG